MKRHSHDDIFDARGCLKDGRTYRVKTTLMDSAAPVQRVVARSGRVRAVDLRFGDDNGLRRPGFRVSHASSYRASVSDNALARQRAYAEYDAAITDAWRNPTAADADADENECPDCDGEGMINGAECATCGGTGEVDDDDGTERETSDNSRRVTARDPAGRETGTFTEEDTRLARDHAANMDHLYADHDRRLSQAWRGR